MTQEDKNILLKDLCARLPYRLKFQSYHSECGIEGNGTFDFEIGDDATLSKLKHLCESGNNKPYLRPMSSMTEEEKSTYMKLRAHALPFSIVEWLDKNHFDHRTNKDGEHLIEIGLALEAKEGMYKTE